MVFQIDDESAPLHRPGAWTAAALLVAAAILVVAGLGAGSKVSLAAAPHGGSDAALYKQLVQDVSHGQAYYVAAAQELRRGGYPLRPFMAVRPPLLTRGLALLPDEAARRAVLAGLAGVTLAAWAWRLRALWGIEPVRYAWALALLATGIAPALAQSAYAFHEVWAGLLIALSLALRHRSRWGASLAVGLLAGLTRELAIPFLGVMAVLALIEGRRKEAFAWASAVAVVLAVLAGHAHAVMAVTTPLDRRSPGWLGLGGWQFVLQTSKWNVVTCLAPSWVSALLLPLAGLGLLLRSGELGRRTGLVALGFMAGFCVVGRPDNDYWGLMIAPLWPLGLVFADTVVKSLAASSARLVGPAPRLA